MSGLSFLTIDDKEKGHKGRKGTKKKEDDNTQPEGDGNRKKGTCWICGMEGHMAFQCPLKGKIGDVIDGAKKAGIVLAHDGVEVEAKSDSDGDSLDGYEHSSLFCMDHFIFENDDAEADDEMSTLSMPS